MTASSNAMAVEGRLTSDPMRNPHGACSLNACCGISSDTPAHTLPSRWRGGFTDRLPRPRSAALRTATKPLTHTLPLALKSVGAEASCSPVTRSRPGIPSNFAQRIHSLFSQQSSSASAPRRPFGKRAPKGHRGYPACTLRERSGSDISVSYIGGSSPETPLGPLAARLAKGHRNASGRSRVNATNDERTRVKET